MTELSARPGRHLPRLDGRAGSEPSSERGRDRVRVGLPGGEIEVTVRRSPRARRLRVTVDGARGVIVTIPRRGASMATVRTFLAEREPWVRRHVARQAAVLAAHAARGPIDDGGALFYLGQLHRLRVVPATNGVRASSVVRVGGDEGDELLVTLAPRDVRPVAAVLEAWFRQRARLAIDRAIERHAGVLGVTVAAVSVRDQRTRWGSASRHGRLAFSWRLVLAPPGILDSVVVHELAHLRVFGHDAGFWALVASRCPDYRACRTWLRRHSVELHAALTEPPFPAGSAFDREG